MGHEQYKFGWIVISHVCKDDNAEQNTAYVNCVTAERETLLEQETYNTRHQSFCQSGINERHDESWTSSWNDTGLQWAETQPQDTWNRTESVKDQRFTTIQETGLHKNENKNWEAPASQTRWRNTSKQQDTVLRDFTKWPKSAVRLLSLCAKDPRSWTCTSRPTIHPLEKCGTTLERYVSCLTAAPYLKIGHWTSTSSKAQTCLTHWKGYQRASKKKRSPSPVTSSRCSIASTSIQNTELFSDFCDLRTTIWLSQS